MAPTKFHRKTQSSVARVVIASAFCLLVFYVNSERLRVVDSVPSFSYTIQSLTAQVRNFDTATVADSRPPCLPFIFYDKPVKTGSTAVTEALVKYIANVREPATQCTDPANCSAVAIETCTSLRPRGHMIQHVNINSSMTSCLRNKGYYHVTSIREPKERVISAWKYARAKRTNHYGISYNSTIDQFMVLFPRCALFSYYDGLPQACGNDMSVVEARAEEIASRMDEIIDLDEEAITDVHRRIYPFISNVNVASSGRSKSSDLHVPDEVVEAEYVLYNKLREKRLSLAKEPRRTLCPKAQR